MHSYSPRVVGIGLLGLFVSACHHVSDDSGSLTAPAPTLTGFGRFLDVNDNGEADLGDRLTLRFSTRVQVNTTDANALSLEVAGDSFGAGATLAAGATPQEVVITLGAGARLRTRGGFLGAGFNAPSGIDVSDTLPKDAIQHPKGPDARATGGVDIVPEFGHTDQSGLGENAIDLAAADLNRDGFDDFVAANGVDGVDVYERLPAGGFTSFLLDVAGAKSVGLADLRTRVAVSAPDTYAGPDLVVLTDAELLVFENVSTPGGAVAFGTFQTLALGVLVEDMVFVDIDHDGDVDVALATEDGVRLARNDGTGRFSPPEDPLPGSVVDSPKLVVGDVDRNGFDDLLAATDGPNQLLLNDGCGSFSISAVMGDFETRHVALVDLNRDGRLDAIGGGVGDVEVWFGEGDGTFSEVAGVTSETMQTTAMFVLDVDRDGLLDLLWCDGENARVAINDGQGLLLHTGQSPCEGSVSSIAVGDFDRDGDSDAVLATNEGPVLVSGSLQGTWGRARFRETMFDVGEGPVFSLASADFDGDGDPDLGTGRDTLVELRRNLGDGQFDLSQTLDLGDARASDLGFADIDVDGDLDLVLAVIGSAYNIWLNDGNGHFTSWTEEGGGPEERFETGVEIADLDRDGDLDLVISRLRDYTDQIVLNNGITCDDPVIWNGFGAPIDLDENATPQTADVGVADIDADGDVDILLTHAGGVPDRLFRNDGLGGFFEDSPDFGPTDSRSVDFADVDRDGDLDFVLGKPGGNELWHNDGAGGFSLVPKNLGHGATFAALLPQLNGDRVPDLLIGRGQDQGLQFWFGTLDGEFSDGPHRREASQSLRALIAVDVDGTGSIDFIAGRGDLGENRLWLNL